MINDEGLMLELDRFDMFTSLPLAEKLRYRAYPNVEKCLDDPHLQAFMCESMRAGDDDGDGSDVA